MKRFRFAWIAILLICLVVTLNGQGSSRRAILTDIYQKDYDLINRTVLTFSNRPAYRIIERGENRQIIINFDNVTIHELIAKNQNFDSPVLRSIRLSEKSADRSTITVLTHQPVQLRSFEIQVPENKIVLDIYNKITPETDEEKFIFAKFYYATSDFRRAENLLREVAISSPQITGVNYYLGELLLNRNEDREAIERFTKVSFRAEEYLQARGQLMKLGVVNPTYSDETEEAFSFYRDYFLQAEDLNRQTFLLALVSSPFGDVNTTSDLLRKIDYTDPVVSQMTNNIDLLHRHLSRDRELQHLLPVGSTNAGQSSSTLHWFFIVILTALVTAIIVILINNAIWNRRIKKYSIIPPPRIEPVRSETQPARKESSSKTELPVEQKKPESKPEKKETIKTAAIERKKESVPKKDKDIDQTAGLKIPPQFAAEILQETEKELKKKSKFLTDHFQENSTTPKRELADEIDEKTTLPEDNSLKKPDEGSMSGFQGLRGKEIDVDDDLEQVEKGFSESEINQELEKQEKPVTSRDHPLENESDNIDEKVGLGNWPQKRKESIEERTETEEENTLEEEKAYAGIEEKEETKESELPQSETDDSESDEMKESEQQPRITLEGLIKDDIIGKKLSEEEDQPLTKKPETEEEKSLIEETKLTEQSSGEEKTVEEKTGFGYQPPRNLEEKSHQSQSEQKTTDRIDSTRSEEQESQPEKQNNRLVQPDDIKQADKISNMDNLTGGKTHSSGDKETENGKSPDLQRSAMIFEDLKVKLIVQLYQLGWGVDAIAEEMEADVSEIKKVISLECSNR